MSRRCPRLRDKLDYVEEEEYKANEYNEEGCDIKDCEEEKSKYEEPKRRRRRFLGSSRLSLSSCLLLDVCQGSAVHLSEALCGQHATSFWEEGHDKLKFDLIMIAFIYC